MKKTILFIFLGSVVIGMLLLAGISYAFGSIAEAGIRQTAQIETDDETVMTWKFDVDDFSRGIFSSETRSEMHLEVMPNLPIDRTGDEGLPLKHVIYHGPLAMTPDGAKLCSYHVVTTLQVDRMNEKGQGNMKRAFGDAEPVTIHTTTGFGGSQVTRIEVASFSFEEDEENMTVTFEGASGKLASGPDLAFAQGNLKFGAIKVISENVEDGMEMEMVTAPSTASIDYVKGTKLLAKLNMGESKGTTPFSTFSSGATTGEIDWLKSTHFKATLDIGEIEAGGGPEDEGNVIIGPGKATVDLNRISDAFDILVGEAKIHLEGVKVDAQGQLVSMDDLEIRIDTGEKNGKLYGLIAYEVGGIRIPETEEMPIALNELLGKGFKFETGMEGFDLATIENLITKGSELPGLEGMTSLSDFSDPENADRFSEALAENSEILSDYSRLVLDMIQPGLEVYYVVELRGAKGKSVAEISLGMGGTRKLTDLRTTREMLSSIKGKAVATVSKTQLPPGDVDSLIKDGPMAEYVAEHPDRFEVLAELQDGNFFLNGEATPLLDELGPSIDEPFDWEEFIAGMAAGMAGP